MTNNHIHSRPSGHRLIKPRAGFTLAEVALSLSIIVGSSIVILLLIGNAQHQQKLARSQVLASAAAVTMSEMFANPVEDWRLFSDRPDSPTSGFTGVGGGDRGHVGTFYPNPTVNDPGARSEYARSEYLGSDGEADPANHLSYPRRLMELGQAGPFGRYDIERRLIAPYGPLRPLPPRIASRIDSPGNQIQQLLDDGGTVYYMASPDTVDGDWGVLTSGASRGDPADWARIIVGIIGAPQQNILPHHPLYLAPTARYPFPPQSLNGPFVRSWQPDTDIVAAAFDPPDPNKTNAFNVVPWSKSPLETELGSWTDGNPTTISYRDDNTDNTFDTDGASGHLFIKERGGSSNEMPGRDWRTWRHFAALTDLGGGSLAASSTIDPHNPMPGWTFTHPQLPSSGSRSWMDVWRQSLPYFQRMCTHHWQRIWSQLHRTVSFKGSSTRTVTEWVADPPTSEERTFTTYRISVDGRTGDITRVPIEETVTVLIPSQTGSLVTKTVTNNNEVRNRGIPSPPNGLSTDLRHHGSDIMYEDHWPSGWGRGSQIRVGLPSLERRIGYRTSALLLWAAVNGINAAEVKPSPQSVSNPPHLDYLWFDYIGNGSPDVVGAWPNNLANPLLEEIPPPPNPADIHPAQVLALNYLAHAAIMVTGYKPPFLNRHNSPDSELGEDIQRLADGKDLSHLPYRALSSQEVYMFDPLSIPEQEISGSPQSLDATNLSTTAFTEDFSAVPLSDPRSHTRNVRWVIPITTNNTSDGDILNDLRPSDMPEEIVGFAPTNRYPSLGDAASNLSGMAANDYIVVDSGILNERGLYYVSEPTPGNRQLDRVAALSHDDNGLLTTRIAVGPILNPFPPPFADRGVFDWRGNRLINPTENTLASVTGTPSGTPRDVVLRLWPSMPDTEIDPQTIIVSEQERSDTRMAEIALRNAISWAIAYTAEHPNDHIVPKILNRPVMSDQPLFAYDLFGNGTTANHQATEPFNVVSPITWAEHAPFSTSMQGGETFGIGPHHNSINHHHGPFGFDKASGRDFLRREMAADYRLNRFGGLLLNISGYGAGYPDALGVGRYERDGSRWTASYQAHELRRRGLAHGKLSSTSFGNPSIEGNNNLLLNSTSARSNSFWHIKPFQPADRARQVVFWTCDWLAYEDSESAPSAPVDFSHAAIVARVPPNHRDAKGAQRLYSMRTQGVPEETIAWANPMRDATVLGSPPEEYIRGVWSGGTNKQIFDNRTSGPGQPFAVTNIPYIHRRNNDTWLTFGAFNLLWARLGYWGADRNGNGTWDRGPVPRSQRMQADEVARIIIYDPVMWAPIR